MADNLEGERKLLAMLLADLPRMNVDLAGTIEHAYGSYEHHVPWLSLNRATGAATLILFHPASCGCNALTDELVLHG